MHVLRSQSVRDSVQVERQTKIDGSAEWNITCQGASLSLFLCMRGRGVFVVWSVAVLECSRLRRLGSALSFSQSQYLSVLRCGSTTLSEFCSTLRPFVSNAFGKACRV